MALPLASGDPACYFDLISELRSFDHCRFATIGSIIIRGDGPDEPVVIARQRFIDNEPYRAARRGRLIVDKVASRRRFEGWGAWAQSRIQVSWYLSLHSRLGWYPFDLRIYSSLFTFFFMLLMHRL